LDQSLSEEEQAKSGPADITMKAFYLSWRRFIFDLSRVAFIALALVLMRATYVGLGELRLLRTGLVEQSTAMRMAIQLQGREINKNLHEANVSATVFLDRFDVNTTHLRGQMVDVATKAAIATKAERKELVKALVNAESQKESPSITVPEVKLVPVPQPMEPPPSIEVKSQDQPVPLPSSDPKVPEDQSKGGPLKKVWNSLNSLKKRIF